MPGFIFGRQTSAAPNSGSRSPDLSQPTHSDTRTANRSRKGPRPARALRACEPASVAQRPPKPHLRERPVAFDGLTRDVQDLGRLLEAQPTEEAELDDPSLALIDIS